MGGHEDLLVNKQGVMDAAPERCRTDADRVGSGYLAGSGELGPGVVDVVLDPVELGLVIDHHGQPADDHPPRMRPSSAETRPSIATPLPVTPGFLAIFSPTTARIRPRTANTTAAGDKIAVRALVLAGRCNRRKRAQGRRSGPKGYDGVGSGAAERRGPASAGGADQVLLASVT